MATREAEAAEAGGGRILMEGGQFVCPECGRKFGRAQALGAHRQRSHGVEGTSSGASRARAKRAGRKSKTAKTATKTRAKTRAKTKTATAELVHVAGDGPVFERKRKTATNGRKRTTGRKRGPYKRKTATRRTAAPATNGAVDKNALLGTVFPRGLPNNAEAIQRAVAWLEEAEALARL